MDKVKILIVDDEPFNVDYLEQELENSNFDLISAVNGEDALRLIKTEDPDLVLLDIMMPVMDGFEVLTRLKENPELRDIPIIIISATNDLSSVVKGIKLGAEEYLPKPFEPVLLHARVSSCLEKKRLRDIQHLYLKSLEREMDIAREIQKSFLPIELPHVVGWKIAAYFKSAREVSGDFFDSFVLPDGNIVFVIGDVCGKGIGAALFMTLFRSLIRVTSTTDLFLGETQKKCLTPSERLEHVISFTNNYISSTHGEADMFATIFIGVINVQEGTLNYINGGNEPALILKNGEVFNSLPPTGPAVGIIENALYQVKNVQIQKDDLLVVFTDGIPDTLNNENSSFGKEGLVSLLKDTVGQPKDVLTKVEQSLKQFIGEANQFDDITIMAISRD